MTTSTYNNWLKRLSLGALTLGLTIHFLTDYALGGASPLALLLGALCGWVLHQKVELVGTLLLLLASGALLVFPFLNVAPFVYCFLAMPPLAYGISATLLWWKEENGQ